MRFFVVYAFTLNDIENNCLVGVYDTAMKARAAEVAFKITNKNMYCTVTRCFLNDGAIP